MTGIVRYLATINNYVYYYKPTDALHQSDIAILGIIINFPLIDKTHKEYNIAANWHTGFFYMMIGHYH